MVAVPADAAVSVTVVPSSAAPTEASLLAELRQRNCLVDESTFYGLDYGINVASALELFTYRMLSAGL